ncbi:MAG: cadmium resistance transporter [Synechococcaceae cyanobacterium]|nr:cadmium resistance transporter [Synechococcaceae cyanobacterium]
MDEIGTTLQLAMAAGLATTFDDNIYLTGFFSEINRSFRPQHVIVGELLGFSLLVAISLLSFLIGQHLPIRWLGWMGVLPILIGLRNLAQQFQRGYGDEADRQTSQRLYGALPGFAPRRLSLLQLLRDRQTYAVSLVTLANGSNNLSIYIPLFASLRPDQVTMVVPVLYGFIFLWLYLSYQLTRAPGLALLLNRYAPIFFPFVLIWLGFRILHDTGSLSLFG